MPQGPQRLRDVFMIDGSDGVGECEQIIMDAGGIVHRGLIYFDISKSTKEIDDAIQFLVEEWDYDFRHATIIHDSISIDVGDLTVDAIRGLVANHALQTHNIVTAKNNDDGTLKVWSSPMTEIPTESLTPPVRNMWQRLWDRFFK